VTWEFIVDLLTRGQRNANHKELMSVSGIAASVITDQAPESAPIIITCKGPRTRIYCVFDDEAVEDDGDKEGAFGFDPLEGDWAISLPCLEEELSWVQSALKNHSARITARDASLGIAIDEEKMVNKGALELDLKGLLGK
jgi:hypothetical protein